MNLRISGIKKAQIKDVLNYPEVCEIANCHTLFFSDAEESSHHIRGLFLKKILEKRFVMSDSRNTPCFCGSGKKHKKCHPDINPNSLIANYYKIAHLIDEEIKSCQYTVCKKGCSDCCTDDFEVSVSEFFAILNYLQISCSDDKIEEICKLSRLKISEKTSVKNTNAFSRCLFVKENDNSCEIYEVRPIVCRKYGYYKLTDCPIINADEEAKKSLINNSEVDTQSNINFFHSNGNKIFQKPKPIIYWFSRFGKDGFATQRMNDLYSAALNLSISEYVRILNL